MSQGLEQFMWHRSENGYEWIDGNEMELATAEAPRPEDRERMLIAKRAEKHWFYQPLVLYPTLFREFAALEPTEDGFLGFANKYGDLGFAALLHRSGPITFVDPFDKWRSARHSMGSVVDVLTAIQERDIALLRQWFTLANNGAKYERHFPNGGSAYAWVAIAGTHNDFLWKWATEGPSDDEAILRVARGWAQHEINGAIGSDSSKATQTRARILFDHDKGKMVLHLVPANLLAAMWLQCARVLTLNPVFRSCEHCGKWFELSPESRRRQSKYCSGRCKVAAYRAGKTKPSASIAPARQP